MSRKRKSPEIEPPARAAPEEVKADWVPDEIETLARELCVFHGHDPDAMVFPGVPDTIRTNFERAYVIPKPELQIAAWQLFQSQALAVRHLKSAGFLG